MSNSVQRMLAAAFKAITVPDLDGSRLVPEQAERFIRVVERRAVVLGETRRLTMTADRRNIDRTGFSSRILKSPQAEGTVFSEETAPDFFTNELVAAKGRGRVSISDESLEENIEREGFENTLVDMIAERSGVDLEEAALVGDTSGSTGDYIDEIDGWLLKAAQSVDETDFTAGDIEDVFDTMLLAVDDKYLRDLDSWRFYVPWSAANAYRDILRARETALGDQAQTEANPLRYKGVRVRVASLIGSGAALLTEVNNTAWGIRRDIEIEPERRADADRWDFHVRVKADVNYEDENAAVAASGTGF